MNENKNAKLIFNKVRDKIPLIKYTKFKKKNRFTSCKQDEEE